MNVTTRSLVAILAAALAPAVARAQQDADIRFAGEVRTRTEWLPEWSADGATRDADAYSLLRSRVSATGRTGRYASFMVQIQDSRVFGEETNTLTDATANAIDLHQGWLQLAGKVSGLELSLRAGRQEIALANERLMGAVGWSNTGRAFDAARLLVGADANWQGVLFLATVHESSTRFGVPAVSVSEDHVLAGAFGVRGPLEVFAFFDRGAQFRSYADVHRMTLGARAQPELGGVRLDVEAAWQTGSQQRSAAGTADVDQDIAAWLIGARAAIEPGRFTANAGVDWLSGDASPADDSYSAFNALYGTNHKYYGFMDLLLDPAANTRDLGLIDVMVGAGTSFGKWGSPRADLHAFRLATSDPVAGSDVGWELDLTWPLRLGESAWLDAGWSGFLPGEAGQSLGLGTDGELRQWLYVQARVAAGL